MVAHVFKPSTREAEAGGFLSSRPGLQSEFQDSQGYTEKPCLEKPKEKKKDNVIVNLAPNRKWKRQVIKLGSGLKKLGSRDRAL